MAFLGLRKRERVDRQTPVADEVSGNGDPNTPVAEEPGANGTAMPQDYGRRSPAGGAAGTGAPAESQREPMEPTRAPMESQREPMEPTRAPMESQRAPMESQRAPMEPTRARMEPAAAPVEGTRRRFGAADSVPAEGAAPGRGFGLGLVGLLILLAGAWAGIVPYVGPAFGYDSHGQPSWQWNLQHGLLYLLPGAVAVVAGLLIIAAAGRVARGHGSIGSGVLGLIVAACGAWLVLGPVVWPLFYSSPVFTSGSAWDNFIYQLGYNLGPGLVLVLLSGLAMGLSARAGRAVTAATPTTVPETPENTWRTRRSA